MAVKYCWLKPDYSFSDSWGEDDHKEHFTDDLLTKANEDGWSLIRYEVLTDKDIELPPAILTHKRNANCKSN